MLGQALGLKDEEFDALQADNYRDSPLFDDREKAVMAWAWGTQNCWQRWALG